MRNVRYILLILLLCPLTLWGQRRFSIADKPEKSFTRKGFSTRDVQHKTDALFGLHASFYTGSHHLIGVSAEGSWSAFYNNMPQASVMPGGGAAGVHFLYEYQYSGLIIQTGLGLAYQRVFNNISDTTMYHYNLSDTWSGISDRKFDLRHRFYDRQDMAQHIYGQLPLYIGHYIFGPTGIGYVLAGVHVNYMIWGNTLQKLTGSSAGKYHDFIGVWDEMDNHGFRKDVEMEKKGSALKLNLDLLAHLEIGYEYNTQQSTKDYKIRPSDRMDCRIRIAGFAEFGILDICPRTEEDFYGLPMETLYDFPSYRMNHVFSTKDASEYWMRNLFAGIRLTVLFGFQPAERCILCDPWRH